ncbi:Calsenilin [Nymphon striatum]|nr:Calsenilin [Nymphon striatum]
MKSHNILKGKVKTVRLGFIVIDIINFNKYAIFPYFLVSTVQLGLKLWGSNGISTCVIQTQKRDLIHSSHKSQERQNNVKMGLFQQLSKQAIRIFMRSSKNLHLKCMKLAPSSFSYELDPEVFEIPTPRYKPECIDRLCNNTNFTRKELQTIYRSFKQACPLGLATESLLQDMFSQIFPHGDSSLYAHFVFKSFDHDGNGSLNFESAHRNMYKFSKALKDMSEIMRRVVVVEYNERLLSLREEKTPSELLLGYNLRNRLSLAASAQKSTKIIVRNGGKLWVRDYRKNAPKWDADVRLELTNSFHVLAELNEDLDRENSQFIRTVKKEFVVGLSSLSRGTFEDKLRWTFKLYDINGDGRITREELNEIVMSIYNMVGKDPNVLPDDQTPKQHVERVFKRLDVNADGVVTIEEFMDICQKVL